MSEYHDDRALASDPIPVVLSPALFSRFYEDLGLLTRLRFVAQISQEVLAEHVQRGDSRAAMVVRVEPEVVVAAYTDELDCVVMLRFPDWVREVYPLRVGAKLLTINTYMWISEGMARDLTPGPRFTNQYGDFYPVIAEFVGQNLDVIEARKSQIADDEWLRTIKLAKNVLEKNDCLTRDGNPLTSPICLPALRLNSRSQGLGWLFPLFAISIFALGLWFVDATMGKGYYRAHGWPKLAVCWFTAFVLLVVGVWINSGKTHRNCHSMLSIPVQYWSVLLFLLGVLSTFA